MEITQIKRGSATSRIVSANLPKGHLNGCLVAMTVPDGTTHEDFFGILNGANVRAEFIHDRNEYLNVNTPLSAMVALSDINHGSIGSLSRLFKTGGLSDGTTTQHVSDTAASDLGDPTIVSAMFPFMAGAYTFYLDYGSIYCEDGNEFTIDIEFSNIDHAQLFGDINIYTVSKDLVPFYFKKYDLDYDLNELHKSISEGWIFSETLDRDANVVVETDTVQYDSDLEGFRTATQVFGEIENVDAGILVSIYQSTYGMPEDVWVKITKNGSVALQSEASRLGLLTIRNEFPLALSTKQALRSLQSKQTAVQKFKQDHPDQYIAMVAVGHLDSVETIGQSVVWLSSTYGQFNAKGASANNTDQFTLPPNGDYVVNNFKPNAR